jgi:hypothetical protein
MIKIAMAYQNGDMRGRLSGMLDTQPLPKQSGFFCMETPDRRQIALMFFLRFLARTPFIF